MLAVELVTDRSTKEPAPGETARLFERLTEQGLICSKSGTHRNVLRMVPPLCIQEDDVDLFAAAMETGFKGLSDELRGRVEG